MPFGDRRRIVLGASEKHFGARSGVGILDGWLIDEGDAATIEGVDVRQAPLLMTDPATTAEMVSAGPALGGRLTVSVEHGTAASIEIIPVTGLGEFRPGDNLAAAIAAAAGWLRDDDVVVITSKVLSKTEGRIVTAPHRSRATGHPAPQAHRRRGRARAGPQGQDAHHRERHRADPGGHAGVDGSNIDAAELALLPVDPDGSAAAIRDGHRNASGVTGGRHRRTDTIGTGLAQRTDRCRDRRAPGSIGAARLRRGHDPHGNELGGDRDRAAAENSPPAADLVKAS